jgi:hypothetical protein
MLSRLMCTFAEHQDAPGCYQIAPSHQMTPPGRVLARIGGRHFVAHEIAMRAGAGLFDDAVDFGFRRGFEGCDFLRCEKVEGG